MTLPAPAAPARPPWLAGLRWPLFRALERLSDLRGNVAARGAQMDTAGAPEPALWIYLSTLGELNAVQTLLTPLLQALPGLRPVLITDHAHYRPAYAARLPQASVCVSLGHSRDAARLARRFPPRLLVVGEIPCLPSDAPCRFSYAFVRQARRCGAGVALVNGWLYHYSPPSRMDVLERRWFERAWVRSFDLLCMQDEAGARHLQQAGADPARLVVTGNLKLDAVHATAWQAAGARSPGLLQGLLASGRPAVVAGSLTREDETERVLDAFVLLRQAQPGPQARPLLVLAPRHPEVPANLQHLRQALAARGLQAVWRSAVPDTPLGDEPDALVLDTMGDLRDFYAAATVAHVGVDHNVLEPLAFGKPVSVGPGWDQTYPSWPVYALLAEAGALLQAADTAALAAHWQAALRGGAPQAQHAAHVRQVLARAAGATARHLAALQPLLAAAAR